MSLRVSAILGLIVGLSVPLCTRPAEAEPTASPAAMTAKIVGKSTGSLSAVAKANLIAKLKAAKLHEKEVRKSGPQDSARIAEYDKRIYDINVLITKIGNNEDVALGEVDKALATAQAH